jgi:UDP-2,3-diacylglucosamine pyrophosphatase LpxH
MEKIQHLYIIGNGFDIHHCRKTSYADFYKWANENHEDVIVEIEEKVGSLDAEWWYNFENNLAKINAYEISQTIASENVPNLSDDHVDRQWNDAQIYTEQLFESVYDDIKKLFEEWVQNGIKPTNLNRLISLDKKESFFLTFNYTDTLENSYHVPYSQILHIHGSIYDKEFIIGHGKSIEEITKENEYNYSPSVNKGPIEDDEDIYEYEEGGLELHEQLALDAAISGIASQRKPVLDIIKKNNDRFNSFNEIADIHIYGFSFSDIDLPYLDKIVEVVDIDNVSWEVSDYNGDKKDAIVKFMTKHSISNYTIISLEDKIPNSRQLELF